MVTSRDPASLFVFRPGGYDLLIRDVDMPRMDGIELTTVGKRESAFEICR